MMEPDDAAIWFDQNRTNEPDGFPIMAYLSWCIWREIIRSDQRLVNWVSYGIGYMDDFKIWERGSYD